MIRKATEHDIDAVEQGYTELLTHEKENGSSISGRYPDIILFTDRMRKQHGR